MCQLKVSVIVVASVGLVAALLFLAISPHIHPRQDVRHVTIAVSSDPSSAPIFVAQSHGFFRREGIEASLIIRSTGKAALAEVLAGKAEFATVADTVLMFAALENVDIASIATITESDSNHRIMALRERGISRPADLAGRNIGVTRRTSGEYFLYTFLLFNGIDPLDVTFVDLSPEEMPQALEERRVDAVATWYPTIGKLSDVFGERVITFEDHSYIMGWNVVGYRRHLAKRPVTVQRFVKAIVEARNFMVLNHKEAVEVAARSTGSRFDFLRDNWNMYIFDVRLKDVTIVNLEEQARWAIGLYYPGRRDLPDFRRYLYTDFLRKVDPLAVNIVTEPAT